MKSKPIKKYFVIKDRTLQNNLNVFLGYTFEELNRFLNKRGYEELDDKFKHSNGVAFVSYHNSDNGVPCFTIWIPEFYWVLSKQALLVHELSHIVFMLLDNKGIVISEVKDSANETYAYLLEFLFLELSCKIDKLNK